ncbi:MAG: hypothetical protein JSW72_03175 [Candidatus Bathyarchaeota archaeon]|nr:MAG: hypothetical protein JSW72_03175 [Candidatus Bathyarchaeota archaeon]
MHDGKFVANLNVVVRLLEDPQWSKRARQVKTLEDMRQILLDFCEARGKVVWIDEDTVYLYV